MSKCFPFSSFRACELLRISRVRYMMSACARGIGFGFLTSCLSLITMSVLLVYTLSEKGHAINSYHISSHLENIFHLENVSYTSTIVEDSIPQVATCNGSIFSVWKQAEPLPAEISEPNAFERKHWAFESPMLSRAARRSRASRTFFLRFYLDT